MITDDLIELDRRAAYGLWNVASPTKAPTGLSPRMIFPDLRTGATRVSEQEARHVFCTLLQDTSYYYALEAPTVETYIQTGSTPLSARTDLALYELHPDGLKRIANIEFKAHNASKDQIKKDIEKLVRENLVGNWFHLLSSSNSKTLPSLFKKFMNAFAECIKYATHDIDIVFCFCVLGDRKLFLKRFVYKLSDDEFIDYAQRFFAELSDWIGV